MDSQRELIRRTLMIYLTCRERASGREMGKVVNISHRGMLMITDRTFSLHDLADCRLELPALEGLPREPLDLKAECRWTGPGGS